MKLGTKSSGPAMATEAPEKAENKVSYPGFTLSDDTAKSFQKQHPIEMGQTFTAKVKLKVCRLSADNYGSSIGFDVIELKPDGTEKNSESMAKRYNNETEESED